jgi:hypothetical protein
VRIWHATQKKRFDLHRLWRSRLILDYPLPGSGWGRKRGIPGILGIRGTTGGSDTCVVVGACVVVVGACVVVVGACVVVVGACVVVVIDGGAMVSDSGDVGGLLAGAWVSVAPDGAGLWLAGVEDEGVVLTLGAGVPGALSDV